MASKVATTAKSVIALLPPPELGKRGCKCDCLLCETDVHCLRKGKCKFYVE